MLTCPLCNFLFYWLLSIARSLRTWVFLFHFQLTDCRWELIHGLTNVTLRQCVSHGNVLVKSQTTWVESQLSLTSQLILDELLNFTPWLPHIVVLELNEVNHANANQCLACVSIHICELLCLLLLNHL